MCFLCVYLRVPQKTIAHSQFRRLLSCKPGKLLCFSRSQFHTPLAPTAVLPIMTIEINQEALEAYKRTRNSQSSYSSELGFLPGSGMESPPMSPAPRSSFNKTKPTSDRSLRVDAWVGGHGPEGTAKPRRSWTVKREIKK